MATVADDPDSLLRLAIIMHHNPEHLLAKDQDQREIDRPNYHAANLLLSLLHQKLKQFLHLLHPKLFVAASFLIAQNHEKLKLRFFYLLILEPFFILFKN